MTQYGFFFDQSRCFSCRVCSIVCRDWNNIPQGSVKLLRVLRWEKGTFPNTTLNALAIMCYHCENPVCVDACNVHAIYKEEKYGAILVDQEKCRGERLCYQACPYGSISYEKDSLGTKAQKCNMCIDRLEQGLLPVCVMSCPTRALDFGPIDDMKKKYGSVQMLEDMPAPDLVKPAVVFKAKKARTKIIPYNETKALQLLAKRDPLPPVMQNPTDVNNVAGVTTNKPIFRPNNVKEAMLASKDDMG